MYSGNSISMYCWRNSFMSALLVGGWEQIIRNLKQTFNPTPTSLVALGHAADADLDAVSSICTRPSPRTRSDGPPDNCSRPSCWLLLCWVFLCCWMLLRVEQVQHPPKSTVDSPSTSVVHVSRFLSWLRSPGNRLRSLPSPTSEIHAPEVWAFSWHCIVYSMHLWNLLEN